MRLDDLRDELDDAADNDVPRESSVLVLLNGETMLIERVEYDCDGVRIFLEDR